MVRRDDHPSGDLCKRLDAEPFLQIFSKSWEKSLYILPENIEGVAMRFFLQSTCIEIPGYNQSKVLAGIVSSQVCVEMLNRFLKGTEIQNIHFPRILFRTILGKYTTEKENISPSTFIVDNARIFSNRSGIRLVEMCALDSCKVNGNRGEWQGIGVFFYRVIEYLL